MQPEPKICFTMVKNFFLSRKKVSFLLSKFGRHSGQIIFYPRKLTQPMVKKILLGILILLVVIQFFRPEQNLSDDNTHHISKMYVVPAEVSDVLKVACNDCHTNKTTYPWYSNVQPVAWWLDHHVTDGKRHLNFSAFTNTSIARQNHKFEEIIETVEEAEMPLPSYTWLGLHPEANLTDAQKKTIMDWAQQQMDLLKEKYPADSLEMKRRPPQGAGR